MDKFRISICGYDVKIIIMADTSARRRVKLYILNENRMWDDRGTGHVSSAYVDRFKGMSLLVRSETDGKFTNPLFTYIFKYVL